MLAYVTGSVDEELLAQQEYLVTENRILRNQIRGRIRLTDAERISLASAAKRLGRKALEEVAQIVRPETILSWHRRLIAKKFAGSRIAHPGRTARRETRLKNWFCNWLGRIAVGDIGAFRAVGAGLRLETGKIVRQQRPVVGISRMVKRLMRHRGNKN
jgi:hypothetical protein